MADLNHWVAQRLSRFLSDLSQQERTDMATRICSFQNNAELREFISSFLGESEDVKVFLNDLMERRARYGIGCLSLADSSQKVKKDDEFYCAPTFVCT